MTTHTQIKSHLMSTLAEIDALIAQAHKLRAQLDLIPEGAQWRTDVHEMVREMVNGNESCAELSRRTGIAKSYLSRLLEDNPRDTPGALTLERLGIERRVMYRFKEE